MGSSGCDSRDAEFETFLGDPDQALRTRRRRSADRVGGTRVAVDPFDVYGDVEIYDVTLCQRA